MTGLPGLTVVVLGRQGSRTETPPNSLPSP
jgi:hypothetical protein